MKICLLTATCGRHYCIERSVRFFLNQDYENCVQLIYQNSSVPQRLNNHIDSNRVILINNHTDLHTRKPYETLGDIYRDALRFVPEDTDVINFFDDDDIFLPNHVSCGAAGLKKYGKTGYKPEKSLYRNVVKVTLASNTLEPSIFVRAEHIRKYGFSKTTSDQHLSWVEPLIPELFVDPKGIPTLCYNWGDDFPTFKTSGAPGNPRNFDNYRKSSLDHGDGIITPISEIQCKKYYNLLENAH